MNQVTEKEISAGKDPMGMAATVIYLSCLGSGENKTHRYCKSSWRNRGNCQK